jgi:hypothetical protein
MHLLAKNPQNMFFFRKKPMLFQEKTCFFQEKTNAFSGKNQCFLGFFPSEGIVSDATWMYYVKTKKPKKPLA